MPELLDLRKFCASRGKEGEGGETAKLGRVLGEVLAVSPNKIPYINVFAQKG